MHEVLYPHVYSPRPYLPLTTRWRYFNVIPPGILPSEIAGARLYLYSVQMMGVVCVMYVKNCYMLIP